MFQFCIERSSLGIQVWPKLLNTMQSGAMLRILEKLALQYDNMVNFEVFQLQAYRYSALLQK